MDSGAIAAFCGRGEGFMENTMHATILLMLILSGPPAESSTTAMQPGQDHSGPAALKLTGPTEGLAGQPVAIVVHGLPAVDLKSTVGDQTAWVETLRFAISAPDGADVTLDKELSMTVAPWAWRLRVTFVPPVDGTYVLVCDWNQEPFGLALHRMLIGPRPPPTPPVPPTPPIPPPGPDPPTPPETTGVAYVIVIRKNQDITADQAETLIRLRTWSDARPQQVSQLEFDPDTAGDNGQLWAARVPAGKSLPYWFLARQRVGSTGFAVIREGPLPENWQAIVGEVEGVLQ
jgi:hypothetical protein